MSFDQPTPGFDIRTGCWFGIAALTVSAAALAALALYATTHRGGGQPTSSPSSAAASPASCAGDFRDSHFADTDWTDSLLAGTTLDVARYEVRTVYQGGPDAGSYRSVHLLFAGRGSMYVLHLQRAGVYDASACGRIAAVDMSYALQNRGAPRPLQVFAPAIRQGAAVYIGARTNVDAATWTPFSSPGLHEADFGILAGSGPPHPDFSAGRLEFGYVTANSCGSGSAPACAPEETAAAIGAWHVQVHR